LQLAVVCRLRKLFLQDYFASKERLFKKMAARLKVTQIKSKISERPNQVHTLRSLGLKRIGDIVVKEDSPVVRGMVKTVAHLVVVEEIN
jgi:large subunit ribosomal protein L30